MTLCIFHIGAAALPPAIHFDTAMPMIMPSDFEAECRLIVVSGLNLMGELLTNEQAIYEIPVLRFASS